MRGKTLILLLAIAALAGFQTQAKAVSILGSAESYAVLGGSTVTNTGSTTLTGNVGVSPGTSITGFPPGGVTGGTIQPAGVSLAQSDLTTAYNGLAGMSPGSTLPADLVGLTLYPGTYVVPAGTTNLSGALTLDGQGNANAAWVFQMPSTLITSSNSVVNVINTGSGAGVYWQVGSSATLGTSTAFEGNIVALTSITLDTSATILNGRALARNGAVTLDTNDIRIVCPDTGGPGYSGGLEYDQSGNVVTLPFAPVPEPVTCLAVFSGLVSLVAYAKRRISVA
jgi:hypothetical protein